MRYAIIIIILLLCGGQLHHSRNDHHHHDPSDRSNPFHVREDVYTEAPKI